jgi:hypothetical protein
VADSEPPPPEPPGNGLIRVHRKPPGFRDSLAKYRVRIDGERVGVAVSGVTTPFPVKAGPHEVIIEAHMRTSRSNRLTVAVPPGGECRVGCSVNGSWLTATGDSLAAIIGRRPWIALWNRNGQAT